MAEPARWWLDLVNAASGALLDPSSGLPGLDQVRGFDRISALGVVAAVYVVFALVFLLHRLKLVVLTGLLLGVAPLAIAAGALPFGLAQRFFRWWLATFLAVTFVQVLQASVAISRGVWRSIGSLSGLHALLDQRHFTRGRTPARRRRVVMKVRHPARWQRWYASSISPLW
jgi:hypothetical protein